MPPRGCMQVPTCRLLPIMSEWLDRGGRREHLHRGVSAWRLVLENEHVDELVADRLLTALERNDAWHFELADLWERMLEVEAA